MRLGNMISGGLAALALGGCASQMDKRLIAYKMQDTGIVVPKLGPSMAEKYMSKSFMSHNIRKYDTNHDKNVDIIEVVTADLSTLKSTERNLIVDIDRDEFADVVYSDMVRVETYAGTPSEKLIPRVTPGVDGVFDMATDARVVATIILGRDPTMEELKLEKLASLLMDAWER